LATDLFVEPRLVFVADFFFVVPAEACLAFVADFLVVASEERLAFFGDFSVVATGASPSEAAAAERGAQVQGRLSKAATRLRRKSREKDLVTAASTFGTRVTTNGTFVNCVNVCRAGA
jgi:hypothetical protein